MTDITKIRFLHKETDVYKTGSDHWNTVRRNSIKTNISEDTINLAKQSAKNIALKISNSLGRDDYIF